MPSMIAAASSLVERKRKWSHSVVSNSLRPQLLSPWDFPGKSTGVGCYFLLQGVSPTLGLNPVLLHCRQALYRLSHQGSPTYYLVYKLCKPQEYSQIWKRVKIFCAVCGHSSPRWAWALSVGWSCHFVCIPLPPSPCGFWNHCPAFPSTRWALFGQDIHACPLSSHSAWVSFNILWLISAILPWKLCLPLPGLMPGLAASASHGNLLETWTLRPHPRPTEWGTRGVAQPSVPSLTCQVTEAHQSLRTTSPRLPRNSPDAADSWAQGRLCFL